MNECNDHGTRLLQTQVVLSSRLYIEYINIEADLKLYYFFCMDMVIK